MTLHAREVFADSTSSNILALCNTHNNTEHQYKRSCCPSSSSAAATAAEAASDSYNTVLGGCCQWCWMEDRSDSVHLRWSVLYCVFHDEVHYNVYVKSITHESLSSTSTPT